jgi:DNA-binding MarR family transcriptional regulator
VLHNARVPSGFELALLLSQASEAIVDGLLRDLGELGFADARPVHCFALHAIGADGTTVSELGRRLGVSKQAAAKTAEGLEVRDYAVRELHPTDTRALLLQRTPRGEALVAASGAAFERLQASSGSGLDALASVASELERIARQPSRGRSMSRIDDDPGTIDDGDQASRLIVGIRG